jgi:hypothetical protein
LYRPRRSGWAFALPAIEQIAAARTKAALEKQFMSILLAQPGVYTSEVLSRPSYIGGVTKSQPKRYEIAQFAQQRLPAQTK